MRVSRLPHRPHDSDTPTRSGPGLTLVDMYTSSTMAPMDPKAPRLFKVICVLTIGGNVLLIIVNLLKALTCAG
jgi:hypothetical protein